MNRSIFRTCLFLVASLGALSVSMANTMDGKVRVDIISQEVGFESFGVTSAGGITGRNQTEDGIPHTLIGYWDADDMWEKATISFVPTDSGRVNLLLLGSYVVKNLETKEMQIVRACFDDIVSDEVLIHNGNFENLDSYGMPRDWLLHSIAVSNPVIDNGNQARIDSNQERGNYANVWHNSRFVQTLEVEKGVKVTISFLYRLH